ncbi:MAG: FAD-binding oxidoreductase [Pirellulales bacterium]|nr:FAD-binding oxidoreductase [Pirellulales bacterium]
MPTDVAHTLPLDDTLTPVAEDELARVVRECARDRRAVYPLGGQTSLDVGLPARRRGLGLSLAGMNNIVDYPARDMTITVEAGLRVADLADKLAAENQWLPIDIPEASQATIGGAIASNASGPRRYAHGTIRDYVIGIRAVDGRGTAFQAGGRVVKNVAGYDFCKLLCGSFGTLAVITQVTLKIKPRPPASAWAWCELPSLEAADKLLATLTTSATTPTAIELLTGPPPDEEGPLASVAPARLLIGYEGTAAEVAWQLEQIQMAGRAEGVNYQSTGETATVQRVWSRLTEFSVPDAEGVAQTSALAIIKASVLSSMITNLIRSIQELAPTAAILAHAGSGIVTVRLSETPLGGLAAAIVRHWQPAARAARGNLVLLAARDTGELTRQVVWGMPQDDARLQLAVKQQFDPHGILNPGRFVYGSA